MTNPWLKQNPLMSMWLSAFNIAANTVRGHAGQQIQRQAAAATAQATKAWMDAWFGVPALIAAIALFTAWYYTYRVERRSALFLFLIYALIDGILTMAVYGVLVFGAF